ncbi:MAG: Ca-activated chloride channel family protein [Sulfurimonas sp.]|jgi:Ca-activated chloride channel family protein
MILLYPYFLVLFFIPLLFWIYLIYSQKKSVFTQEVKLRLSTSYKQNSYTKSPYLWLLMFALITISLSRPLLLVDTKNEGQKLPMGMLAINLDISKSMLAEDISPNRLEFSKNAIINIFKKMPDFRISLSAFSRDVFMVAPFTEDKETLGFLLENLDQNSMSSQGSSIEAVMMGAEKLYAPFKRDVKDVLIVTDGADGLGIQEAIKKAQEYNLRVHLFLVGTKEGTTIKDKDGKLIVDQDEKNVITKRADELQELSTQTGGVFVISNGSYSDLDWLCEQISIKAHKEETLRIQKNYSKELFHYPLALAAFILFFIVNTLHIKQFTRFLPLLLLGFLAPQNLHSDILDFFNIIKSESFYNWRGHKEGLEYFKKVNASKNSASTQYNLANSYYRNNDFEKAIELYSDINTTNQIIQYERLHNLGNAYYKLGQNEEAMDAYAKALKIRKEKATEFNLAYIKKMDEKASSKKSKKKKEKKKKNKKKEKKKAGNKKQKNTKPGKDKKKGTASKATKPMDAKEAKKWKKILRGIKPKTKPKILIKNKNEGKSNEIYW